MCWGNTYKMVLKCDACLYHRCTILFLDKTLRYYLMPNSVKFFTYLFKNLAIVMISSYMIHEIYKYTLFVIVHFIYLHGFVVPFRVLWIQTSNIRRSFALLPPWTNTASVNISKDTTYSLSLTCYNCIYLRSVSSYACSNN